MTHTHDREHYGVQSLACHGCSQPVPNLLPPQSAFIQFICRDPKCSENGVLITVEKATMIALFVDRTPR